MKTVGKVEQHCETSTSTLGLVSILRYGYTKETHKALETWVSRSCRRTQKGLFYHADDLFKGSGDENDQKA